MYQKTIILKTQQGRDAGLHVVTGVDMAEFRQKWAEAWDKYATEALESSLYIFASPAGAPVYVDVVRRFGPSAREED